jgi:hypothetical protein
LRARAPRCSESFSATKDGEPTSALPVIRNVTIGRTVVLDPLAWRRFGGETKFALDRDTLEITAQGLIKLNDGAFVHRFYTDDEILFQAVSDDREGQKANDFTVFVPWASEYPADRADRDLWSQRLRARTFHPRACPPMTRLWFGEEAAEQDPVTFWEDVYLRSRRPSGRTGACSRPPCCSAATLPAATGASCCWP